MGVIRTSLDVTSNKDLFKTGGLRKIFDNTVREAKVEYPILVNDLTSKDEYERDLRMAGLTDVIELAEGQAIPYNTPTEGTTKTYTQRQFGGGFRMTFRMDYFNKYNLWARWSKDLGKKMKEAKDVEIATMFKSPTSTTLTCGVGFDTYAMAYDTHTGLATGTGDNYDNYLNAALSISSLESARYYFAKLVDDQGSYMGATPTLLVVEPTLYITAKEIIGSEKKSGEASNTINVLSELDLKIFEYHRLSSATMWFVLAKADPNYDINVFTALEPKFFEKDAPDTTQDKIISALQFFTYGFGDPRCYYLGKL